MLYRHGVVSDRLDDHCQRLLFALVVAVKGFWAAIPTPLTVVDAPDHTQRAAFLRRREQTLDVSFRRAAEVLGFERADHDVGEPHKTFQRGRLRQIELLLNSIGCGTVGYNSHRRSDLLERHSPSAPHFPVQFRRYTKWLSLDFADSKRRSKIAHGSRKRRRNISWLKIASEAKYCQNYFEEITEPVALAVDFGAFALSVSEPPPLLRCSCRANST